MPTPGAPPTFQLFIFYSKISWDSYVIDGSLRVLCINYNIWFSGFYYSVSVNITISECLCVFIFCGHFGFSFPKPMKCTKLPMAFFIFTLGKLFVPLTSCVTVSSLTSSPNIFLKKPHPLLPTTNLYFFNYPSRNHSQVLISNVSRLSNCLSIHSLIRSIFHISVVSHFILSLRDSSSNESSLRFHLFR